MNAWEDLPDAFKQIIRGVSKGDTMNRTAATTDQDAALILNHLATNANRTEGQLSFVLSTINPSQWLDMDRVNRALTPLTDLGVVTKTGWRSGYPVYSLA